MSKAPPGRARLESLDGGRFQLSGVLDATTAGDLLEQSRERFRNAAQLQVDLAGVTEADSAGLALLIEWMRMAKDTGSAIRFEHVPAQITALARISEVEALLFGSSPTVNAASA